MHESYTVYIYICIIIIKPYIWKKQLFYFWLLKQPNILACRSRMGRSEGETNCKRGLQWGARHSYPIYPPAFNRKKWIEKSEKPPLSLPIVPQSLQGGAPAHELSWCKYPQQLGFLVFSGIFWYISRYLDIYLSIYLSIYIYIHISIIDVCEGSKPTNTGGAPTCRFWGKNSHSASLRGQRTSSACRC